jgi:hypothetical protein
VDDYVLQFRNPRPQDLLDMLRATMHLAHVGGGREVQVDDGVQVPLVYARAPRTYLGD